MMKQGFITKILSAGVKDEYTDVRSFSIGRIYTFLSARRKKDKTRMGT